MRSGPVDALVLDVNLGDIDGFEVCRLLRRDGHDVPIIFLTARDEADDLRTGFREGGDDYLTKPFSLEELGLRIEALLRRSRGVTAESGRIGVDRLVLDEDAHRVTWDGADIELSPTEFRLLGYLKQGVDPSLCVHCGSPSVWLPDLLWLPRLLRHRNGDLAGPTRTGIAIATH